MYLSSFAGNTHPYDVLVRVLSLPDYKTVEYNNIIPLVIIHGVYKYERRMGNLREKDTSTASEKIHQSEVNDAAQTALRDLRVQSITERVNSWVFHILIDREITAKS